MNSSDPAIEDAKEEELKHKIRMVISRLMLSNFTKLISIILYRFKFEIVNVNDPPLDGKGLACVMWEKQESLEPIPIIFLSTYLHDWSTQELAFLIIHEILHVLDKHHRRLVGKDREIANLACDHVINIRLKQDISNGNAVIVCPASAFYVPSLEKENLTVEEVYDHLMKNKPKRSQPGCGGSGSGLSPTGTNTCEGKETDINQDIKEPPPETDIAEGSNKVIEDMKGSITIAKDSEPFKSLSKSRGDKSGGLTEFLNSIIEVHIPWDILLEKAIKKCVRVPSENRSWRNLNKRMRSHGLNIPSHANDEMVKSNLYILADHSASVSRVDLKRMGSLIMQSIGHFEVIKIIKHDTRVVEEVEIDISSSTDAINDAINGKGRGGTNHKCVFNEIRNKLNDEDTDEDIGLILIITDYESNIEEIWDSYDWTKTIPVKIILTQHIKVSTKVDDSPIILKSK